MYDVQRAPRGVGQQGRPLDGLGLDEPRPAVGERAQVVAPLAAHPLRRSRGELLVLGVHEHDPARHPADLLERLVQESVVDALDVDLVALFALVGHEQLERGDRRTPPRTPGRERSVAVISAKWKQKSICARLSAPAISASNVSAS